MADKGWPRFHFSDLINNGTLLIGDGYRAKNNELGGTGPIFLRSQHVKYSYIDFSGVDRFHAELADAVAGKMSKAGDVIITTKGNSTGRVSYAAPNFPSFVYSPHLSFWRSLKPDILLPDYLRYWSRGKEFQQQLSGLSCSTDMAPYLSLTDQKRLKITLPPIEEQQVIARILGSLDDKIEANSRMNETLEAMARTLFKSWFVDFDPVRARAEGRALAGMDAETAMLFPDGFEDSEIGEVPHGWMVRPIGEVVNVLGGGTPSTKDTSYWEGGTHSFCTPKDMSSLTSPVLLNTERYLTDKGLAKVNSGQLPIGTVLMSSRAPIGYLAISEIPVSINQGIIAMVCEKELPNLYVLQWAQANMEGFIAVANGSTFLEISKWNFRPIKALVPPPQVLKEFSRAIEPLYFQIINNLRESQVLMQSRDVLLPQLISGGIPVSGRDA